MQIQTLLHRGDISGAETLCTQTLKHYPNSAKLHLLLGNLYLYLNLPKQALPAFEQAHHLQPSPFQYALNVARVKMAQNEDRSAYHIFSTLIEQEPNNPELLYWLGICSFKLTFLDKAQDCFTALLSQQYQSSEAHYWIALIQERKGQAQAALQTMAPLLAYIPYSHKIAILYISLLRQQKKYQAALDWIAKLLPQTKGVFYCELLYNKGIILDKMGHYSEAFQCITKSKKSRYQPYSFETVEQQFEIIRHCFPNTKPGLTSQMHPIQPIFIIGFPRSGSTLIEQILDSHPQITGCGETNWVSQTFQYYFQSMDRWEQYWENLTSSQLQELALSFLTHLSTFSSTPGIYCTDKTLFNYFYLGLIEKLWPQSLIIHCVRNPWDTCLSCYFQNFESFFRFNQSLDTLGHFYAQYQQLMSHWKQHLDISLFEISYEELIAAPEKNIRRLLDFCQLEWHEACLNFHQNTRPVSTASYLSVKQPLYKHSIDRAKVYTAELKPLKKWLSSP